MRRPVRAHAGSEPVSGGRRGRKRERARRARGQGGGQGGPAVAAVAEEREEGVKGEVDRPKWLWTKCGLFYVKCMYNHLSDKGPTRSFKHF